MLDDRRLYPIYAHCQERDVPIAITLSGELVRLVRNPWQFASPMPLHTAAQDFPRLQFVITHGAWPAVQEILGLAFAFPNVWVSPDLYMVGTQMPFAHEYIRAANLYLGERLLFGTGYPSRGHVDSVRAFEAWCLPPGVRENVLYRNALRLMRIDA
jgi:predicted TIM-barrel fold metal-dependent hydrolase